MSAERDPLFFRHEYGRLVALLTRRFGPHHLERIEDAAQHALLAALESWPHARRPENPSAWLFRVAYNHTLEALRRDVRRERIAESFAQDLPGAGEAAPASAQLASELRDDLLRMMFVCCDEGLPVESQLALSLKTLSGFDVREIAERLFLSEASVYKRLDRARARLRELAFDPDAPFAVADRLPRVQAVLHLMFTEGHLSSHEEGPIRRELCDEAIRLATTLVTHADAATPESFALLALMHLHTARMDARDATGGLLLLEEQDRSRYDARAIAVGLELLARSAEGETFSRYHAEAGIAAEHCLAPSFAETRWDRIVASYELLERAAPSPLHTLNKAVALAELRGPREALSLLERLAPPTWLAGSFYWSAVRADLHRRVGDVEQARMHADAALVTAPSEAIRSALARRLRLGSGPSEPNVLVRGR